MALNWWTRLLSLKFFSFSPVKSLPSRRSRRPLLFETLEDRTVPSTAVFFQGFEAGGATSVGAGGTQLGGWNMSTVEPGTFLTENDVIATASGVNSINAATGAFYGKVAQQVSASNGSAFTPWGTSRAAGYTSTFPAGGFVTSVDVYLDPTAQQSAGTADDKRFDWVSSVNTPGANFSNFRRDFAFNVGFYKDTNTNSPGSGLKRYVVSASNNSLRSGAFPMNADKFPIAITGAGSWYTFQTSFLALGDNTLSATLQVLYGPGSTVGTPGQLVPGASWTLHDSTDVIGTTVGGHRYGFFAQQELPFLAMDNTKLSTAAFVAQTVTFGDNGDTYTTTSLKGGTITKTAAEEGPATSTTPFSGSGPGTNGGTVGDITDKARPLPHGTTVPDPDGSVQHSMIREITINFGTIIYLAGTGSALAPGVVGTYPNTAITLGTVNTLITLIETSGPQTTAAYTFNVTVTHSTTSTGNPGKSSLKLTFDDSSVNIRGGSLRDGNYSLQTNGSLLFNSAGDTGADRTDTTWRYFGDINGDRFVDDTDSALFVPHYTSPAKSIGDASLLYAPYLNYFIAEGPGPNFDHSIDGDDNTQFGFRYKPVVGSNGSRLNTDGTVSIGNAFTGAN